MWLVQSGNVLLEWPDDAPVPPGSTEVELPDDYFDHPEAYVLQRGRIVRRSDEELAAFKASRAAALLSRDEISKLKDALREGRI